MTDPGLEKGGGYDKDNWRVMGLDPLVDPQNFFWRALRARQVTGIYPQIFFGARFARAKSQVYTPKILLPRASRAPSPKHIHVFFLTHALRAPSPEHIQWLWK